MYVGAMLFCSAVYLHHPQVKEGVIPGQYGTWPFGRGGWCPGAAVDPFVADVSQYLKPPGQVNTITYVGLFEGQSPTVDTGYIELRSGIVLYSRWVRLRLSAGGPWHLRTHVT